MPPRDEFDDPEGFFSRLITVSGNRRPGFFENRSLMISAAVFVVVVALSGVIWASYPAQNPLSAEGSVPVIRADAQPYKYVPADRGGMAIAHRDSTIFGAMRRDSKDGKVENLLSSDEDEAPIDRQELFAGLKSDLADSSIKVDEAGADRPVQLARMGDYVQERPLTESERREQAARRNREMLEKEATPLPGEDNKAVPSAKTPANVFGAGDVKPTLVQKKGKGAPSELSPEDEAAEEAEAQDATRAAAARARGEKTSIPPVVPFTPEKSAKGKEVAKETKETIGDVAKKAEGPEKAPSKQPAAVETATTAPKVKTGGATAYVQVASVPAADRIPGEWASVSGKLPMIAGLPYRVQKADVPGKGTYHRIQVGPMSKDAADSLCSKIKAQKPGGCLVIK